MSQTFTITPRKRLLRTPRVLTVGEALRFGPDGLQPVGLAEEELDQVLGTIMPGVVRGVSLTPEMVESIRQAPSPADRFGEICTEIQNEPGYDARLQLLQDPDGNVVGVYALTQGVRTVLPRTPHLPPGQYPELRDEELTWKLALVADDDDGEELGVIGEVEYTVAMDRLGPDSFHLLDAASLVVHERDGEGIRTLAG